MVYVCDGRLNAADRLFQSYFLATKVQKTVCCRNGYKYPYRGGGRVSGVFLNGDGRSLLRKIAYLYLLFAPGDGVRRAGCEQEGMDER